MEQLEYDVLLADEFSTLDLNRDFEFHAVNDSNDVVQPVLDVEFDFDNDNDSDDIVHPVLDGDFKFEGLNDFDDIVVHPHNCVILSKDDVCALQKEDIQRVSTLLSISRAEAVTLLHRYDWNVSKVLDEWLTDEEKVRKAVGLLERPIYKTPDEWETTCGKCSASFPEDMVFAAACGHPFCESCWKGYMSTAIKDGCVTLKCPEPSCSAAVGQDMIYMLASKENQGKYEYYLLRSYLDNNKKVKWCPEPGCEFAVHLGPSSGNCEVTCRCSHSFCWNCCNEAHRPVDCNTIARWISERSAQSENWLLSHSEPCPMCKRLIVDDGFIYTKCTPPCEFEFCWLCRSAWSEHENGQNNFYGCYGNERLKGKDIEENEFRIEAAKVSLEKYTRYYEGWVTNESHRANALTDVQLTQSMLSDMLQTKLYPPKSELKILTDARLQILHCRRVLKWTYAYGYFLPDHEYLKRELLEHLQGQAESLIERLIVQVEFLQAYVFSQQPSRSVYDECRKNLAILTRATRNYYEKLVRDLEEGLSDVKVAR